MCMQVSIYRESYQAYRERKTIISNQAKIFTELEIVRGTRAAPQEGDPESDESAKTVSYDRWNAVDVPWTDFEEDDATSQPPPSRPHGKDPVVDDSEEEEEENQQEEDDEEEGDEEDDDDEETEDDE